MMLPSARFVRSEILATFIFRFGVFSPGQGRLSLHQPALVGRQLGNRRDYKESLALFCRSLLFGGFLLYAVGNGSGLLGWLAVSNLGLDVLDERLLGG